MDLKIISQPLIDQLFKKQEKSFSFIRRHHQNELITSVKSS